MYYLDNDKKVTIITEEELLNYLNYITNKNKNFDINYFQNYLNELKISKQKNLKIDSTDKIINNIINMYKDILNLEMLEKSIVNSLFDLEYNNKFLVQYFYKKAIIQKMNNLEQTALDEIRCNDQLMKYVVYTQTTDYYLNNEKIKTKLKKYL